MQTTITKAFEELMQSSSFKAIAKEKSSKGSHYRMMKSRYNRDTLKYGAMVDLLIEHGYTVTVKKK